MKIIKKVAQTYSGGTPIVTTIDDSSTNAELPGAKAVYDFVEAKITYGTADLTPGTSPLDEGIVYLVYE